MPMLKAQTTAVTVERVLTAAARSINESSSAREIEFQHVTPINNVGVACLGQ